MFQAGQAPVATAAAQPTPNPVAPPPASPPPPTVELSDNQLRLLAIGPVTERGFPPQVQAGGSVDANEDRSVQVFTPYQGKIISALANINDAVVPGQPLFTIDSTDLLQAESTLLSDAGVLDLTNSALARARKLYSTQGTGGIAAKDVEQAVADQQTADGALKSARDAVRVFGKTDAEIDDIVAKRRIDAVLVVRSPIAGKVTARNAQPGLLLQPGNAPAPYVVTDTSTVWLMASIAEISSAAIRVGQPTKASVLAYPGRVFEGVVTAVAATIDPSLHTLMVRSQVDNPGGALRPGMFAEFGIETGAPVVSAAVPVNAVVREGDGTMTVWVTTDRRHFTQREVSLGLQLQGFDQIRSGLQKGETVVTDGAVFLDNMLQPAADD